MNKAILTDNATSLELHRAARVLRQYAQQLVEQREAFLSLLGMQVLSESCRPWCGALETALRRVRLHLRFLDRWLAKTGHDRRVDRIAARFFFRSLQVNVSPPISLSEYESAPWRDLLERRMNEIEMAGFQAELVCSVAPNGDPVVRRIRFAGRR